VYYTGNKMTKSEGKAALKM